MPIYLEKCKKCEHEWELFYTSFSEAERDEAGAKCPLCEATEKERIIGATSFVLKGRGWAKDGYGGGRRS